MSNLVTIPEFYAGKNVFMTGMTGFVGKPLLEKLLRCCPDIGNIYVLVREKKGKKLHERLQKTFEDKLFDSLKQENPGILEKKVIPVAGDCMELNLGINATDREMITKNVSVIFHVAASVRFDDKLRDAIIMNTRGAREVAQLALDTKNLQVLMHVSTTYCNCTISHDLEEKIYPAPTDWRQAITVAERLDPDMLSVLTKQYLGKHPNTYTFSKALSEHVINDMCGGRIPVKIVRPSIVVSTLSDPVSGWIDNFNGPVGLLIACGKGLMRCSYQKPHVTADFIPVDIVVRSIIVAAWDLGLRQTKDHVEVMHSSNGYFKWMSIGEVIKAGKNMAHEIPMNDLIWVPKGAPDSCPFVAFVNVVFFHLIPALFLDFFIKLGGYKPILFKLQTKIFNATLQLRYFTFREWRFSNKHLLAVNEKILPQDKDNWDFEFRNKDIFEFFKNCMRGSRIYLLNESEDTLPKAKKHYQRMWWVDKITMFFLYSFFLWLATYFGLIDAICTPIQNVMDTTVSYLNIF